MLERRGGKYNAGGFKWKCITLLGCFAQPTQFWVADAYIFDMIQRKALCTANRGCRPTHSKAKRRPPRLMFDGANLLQTYRDQYFDLASQASTVCRSTTVITRHHMNDAKLQHRHGRAQTGSSVMTPEQVHERRSGPTRFCVIKVADPVI